VDRFNEVYGLLSKRRKRSSEKKKDRDWMQRMVAKRESDKIGGRKRKFVETTLSTEITTCVVGSSGEESDGDESSDESDDEEAGVPDTTDRVLEV